MTHDVPDTRTVSSSDYHAKCAGCVEREKQIAELSEKIADLETQRKEHEASYRKWGVLPCPSCQAANERIAELEHILAHVQKEMEYWARDSGINYKNAFLAEQRIADLEAQLATMTELVSELREELAQWQHAAGA